MSTTSENYNEKVPKLNISPPTTATPKPFYEQIVDGVKSEISAGFLPPHSPLPSFRVLANQLLVSTITVKRAYEELEREGVIYCRERMGTFVAENGAARSLEIKRQHAETLLKEAIEAAREAGLSNEEFLCKAKQFIRED
jgi:GntR family transcriptional regulator